MSRKIMLIGVGWEQLPLVYKAKEKGFAVVATTSWSGEIPADVIYRVDSRDLDELEKIFQKEKPDAVLADECDYSMYAVAYLTEKYHLPGPSLKALTITNNKFLQRQCGTSCGILQPEYTLCWSWEQARQFAAERGYPIVIKPVDNRGSIGVCVVHSDQELRESWFEAVKNSHSRLVIAEEYINGSVVNVDGYCHKGGFTFLSAGTREVYSDRTTVAKALYYPGLLTKEQFAQLEENSAKIVAEIGISYGFIHIEYLLERKSGKFWLVEIANRGGGVTTSNTILPCIKSVDLMDFYIDHALGAEKTLKIDAADRKVLMYFIEPHGSRNAVDVIGEAKEHLLAFHMNQYSGSADGPIKNATGRVGGAIFEGTDFEEMKTRAKNLEHEIGYSQEECTFYKSAGDHI